MNILIEEINKALKNKCWLAALSLSLSIPDICGEIEHPEITGRGAIGRRYEMWYSIYIEKYYKLNDFVLFNGKQCYALRCKFFHSGNNRIDSNLLNIFQFSFPNSDENNAINSYYESKSLGKRLVLDIAHLSQVLTIGAEEWKNNTEKDLSLLKDFSLFNPSNFYY